MINNKFLITNILEPHFAYIYWPTMPIPTLSTFAHATGLHIPSSMPLELHISLDNITGFLSNHHSLLLLIFLLQLLFK